MNAASTSRASSVPLVLRVRLSDHDKVGVAGDAGENGRQPVERAGFKSRFKNDTAAVGRLAGRGEYRIGLGFGVAQVFPQRRRPAGDSQPPAHEGFGDRDTAP